MSSATRVPSPESFFGFEPGADRKLLNWSQTVDYFQHLASASDRIHVEQFGISTEGRPLIAVYISAPGNLGRLDELRSIQQQLIDQRHLGADEAERLIAAGRSILMVIGSLHPQEPGGSHMTPLLAYDLATRQDARTMTALENSILILIPSLNPDGMDVVHDWHVQTVGTPHEGTWPPTMLHKYVGGENNRDWFIFSQAEVRSLVTNIYNVWFPHVTLDLHQQSSDGFRLVIPPYVDPVDPNVDPTIIAGTSRFGTLMATTLTAKGMPGVATQVMYDSYSPDRNYAQYHAGILLLSEAASCKIATPTTIEPASMRAQDDADPRTAFVNHPLPWPGGEWRLADIVRYDLEAARACHTEAALYREDLLRSILDVQRRAVSADHTTTFILPSEQRDPVALAELLEALRIGRIEIHRARHPFEAGGTRFPAGSYVIPVAQPFGHWAKTLLERREYPALFLYPGGPPRPPYDLTTFCLPLLMGVDCHQVDEPFAATLEAVTGSIAPRGEVLGQAAATYLIGPEGNAAARAVNKVLDAGGSVFRATRAFSNEGREWPAGTFVVEGIAPDVLARIADATHSTWQASPSRPSAPLRRVRIPRIGVYRSYSIGFGICDEGWLRYVLDEYGFPFTTVYNEPIRNDDLRASFDAIIVPQQLPREIVHGLDPREAPGMVMSRRSGDPLGEVDVPSPYPPRYAGGIGAQGGENLRRFVEAGGTLISLDTASNVAIDCLGLAVENALRDLPRTSYYNPGSLLRVRVDADHPIGYGYAGEATVLFTNSPAFRRHGTGRAIASFPEDVTPLAGWVHGPEHLSGLDALVEVPVGAGRAILFGFRPQFRAQARGTYRLLFNALYACGMNMAMGNGEAG